MKFVNRADFLRVIKKPDKKTFSGLFSYQNKTIPCSLGRSGIAPLKHEGDGVTPSGRLELLYGYYRKDRITLPATQFPFFAINQNDGWCDDPKSPAYNSPVKLPFDLSHEKLYRKDNLYDLCIVLNYNMTPITKNRGSAIFFHLTTENKGPTEGCVAIDKNEMLKLIPNLKSGMMMNIKL